MPKDLTAVRLRPEQLKQLAKLAAKDQEASISSLIRRAVDEFLAKRKNREGN
jgi:Arc/MetJ-type ribon-helix-helix transcriptional regulator